MLKQKGPQKWIFEEYAELFNMHFRFKDKQSPRSFVNSLTVKLLVSQFVIKLFPGIINILILLY